MMDLSNFSLMKEDDTHYEVSHPNGKKMKIAKKGLNEKSHKAIKKMSKGGMCGYAEGGEVIPSEAEVEQQVAAENPVMPAPAPQAASPIPEALLPNQPQQASVPLSGGDAIASSDQGSPNYLQQKSSGVEQALQAQKGFQSQEAQALAGQSQAENRALTQTNALAAAMPSQEDIINENKVKDDALFKAFNDKTIDPNRLWHNMSTGSKVAASIGLILGGIGSGLTHTPNAALQVMDNLIEKDLEAQKTDQSKAMNAWKMNREALGNDLAANLATKNQMYTALKYKLMQASTQAGSQVALARAGAANTIIDQQIAQNRMQMSMIQQGMGLGKSGQGEYSGEDPSILVPQLVKDPGAQKDVFKEIERAQVTKRNSANIISAFDKAAQEQGVFSKNLIPGVESAQRKALRTELGPTFQSLEGTVRQAAMDNLDNNIMPQVGDSKETTAVKREALANYLKSAMSAPTAKGYGIDLSKFRSTSAPDVGVVKTMNGVKYMQVPGGYRRIDK